MARDDRFKGAFYQGRERPSLMNRIGGALMGFGEGYAGRGQQFIAARRAEQEKEQNDLMRASISDAKQVLRQLGNIPPADGMQEAAYGNLERMTGVDPASAPTGFGELMAGANQAYNQAGIKESVDILNDRVGLLRERGQDTSETMWLRDKLLTGDIDAAKSEIAGFLAQAKDEGFDVDEQNYVTGLTEVGDGRLARFVDLGDGTYKTEYFGEKTPVSPVTAGSAEGKIHQDYNRGVFGRPGTQEAMAARDAAIAELNYRAPVTYIDQFGVTRYADGKAVDPSISTPREPASGLQAGSQAGPPQADPQTEEQWRGIPFRREVTQNNLEVEPTSERVDLTRFVPPEEAGLLFDPQYPDEPDNQFRDRQRAHQNTVMEYNRGEQQRVDAATEEADQVVKDKGRAIRAYSAAANFLANPRAHQVTGPIQGKEGMGLLATPTRAALGFSSDYIDAKADFESLADILTSENLGMMSGVLSESDITLISRAQADLRTNHSDKRAEAAVEDIVTAYNNYFDELVRRGIMTSAERNAIDTNLRTFEADSPPERSPNPFDPNNPDQAKPAGF